MEFNIIHQPEKMERIVSLITTNFTDRIFFPCIIGKHFRIDLGKTLRKEYSMQKGKRISILQISALHGENICLYTEIRVFICDYFFLFLLFKNFNSTFPCRQDKF
uniref:Uncharacterized protein n=1 Tax=Micrurus lemniscatus lemniscatus TaxID=129467 RepID=A0A2D4JB70_MICLE